MYVPLDTPVNVNTPDASVVTSKPTLISFAPFAILANPPILMETMTPCTGEPKLSRIVPEIENVCCVAVKLIPVTFTPLTVTVLVRGENA